MARLGALLNEVVVKPTSQKLRELPVRVASQRALDEITNEVVELEAKLARLDVEMLTTDEEGNPVGCGMDLLDWQAQLQTELGLSRLKVRELEAENGALREYTTHRDGCFQAKSVFRIIHCSCGLDALLAGDN